MIDSDLLQFILNIFYLAYFQVSFYFINMLKDRLNEHKEHCTYVHKKNSDLIKKIDKDKNG